MYSFSISTMAHNDAICRRAEDAINSLFDMVKENGGKVWIQSKSNKEHYYELTDHVSLNFYVLSSDEVKE